MASPFQSTASFRGAVVAATIDFDKVTPTRFDAAGFRKIQSLYTAEMSRLNP